MSTKNKQQFALVKWIGGKDNGKFTPGIPIEWIRDLDVKSFHENPEEKKKIFIVEWRSKKKEPHNGWELFDAKIKTISDSVKDQEKAVIDYELELSPRYQIKMTEKEQKDLGSKRKQSELVQTPKKRDDSKQRKRSSEKEEEKEPALTPKTKAVIKAIEAQGEATRKIFQTTMTELKGLNNEASSSTEMVPIGSSGEVFLPKYKYESIKDRTTPTAFGVGLMVALIPHEVLLKSNVKGGKAKNQAPGAEDQERRQPLNGDILAAMEEETRKLYSSYNETTFHSALNTKLVSLRSKEKEKIQSKTTNKLTKQGKGKGKGKKRNADDNNIDAEDDDLKKKKKKEGENKKQEKTVDEINTNSDQEDEKKQEGKTRRSGQVKAKNDKDSDIESNEEKEEDEQKKKKELETTKTDQINAGEETDIDIEISDEENGKKIEDSE